MNKGVYVIIALLVILSGILGYFVYSQSQDIVGLTDDLLSANNQIINLNNVVIGKDSEISNLNIKISGLENELSATKQTVKEKEEEIIKSVEQIEELTQVSEEQRNRIEDIIEAQESLNEAGKIIVNNYRKSLILYENAAIYTLAYPFMEEVKDDNEDYSKLGIPFFYFRDETKNEGNKQILGEYSGLYDYIYIYKGINSTHVIYHEIAHIMFKRFFLNNDQNLNVWVNLYNDLKANNLLSSVYSAENEVEGFAEEYSYYKTNGNPNQPGALKDLFRQVDGFIS